MIHLFSFSFKQKPPAEWAMNIPKLLYMNSTFADACNWVRNEEAVSALEKAWMASQYEK